MIVHVTCSLNPSAWLPNGLSDFSKHHEIYIKKNVVQINVRENEFCHRPTISQTACVIVKEVQKGDGDG